jgi:hypothetical protein
MGILVATAARPQNIHFEERLEDVNTNHANGLAREHNEGSDGTQACGSLVTRFGAENGTIGSFESSVRNR